MTYGSLIPYIAGYLDYSWCSECPECFCYCGSFHRDLQACINALEMGYY